MDEFPRIGCATYRLGADSIRSHVNSLSAFVLLIIYRIFAMKAKYDANNRGCEAPNTGQLSVDNWEPEIGSWHFQPAQR